jgi:hypothetical protein
MQTLRLIGGIYEVRRRDELRCHDIHAKFRKDWFTHSKVHTGGYIGTPHVDLTSLLLFIFFQNKESKLKISKKLIYISCVFVLQNGVKKGAHIFEFTKDS